MLLQQTSNYYGMVYGILLVCHRLVLLEQSERKKLKLEFAANKPSK